MNWPAPSQRQMEFIYAVTREARLAGIDKRAFLEIVEIAWRAQEKAAAENKESTPQEGNAP